MNVNLKIKLSFFIILLFVFQIANSKIIVNDDIVMDIPQEWIQVSSVEINEATEKVQEYGIKDKFSKNLIGIWKFNKSQNWNDVSNVKIFRYSNSGDTLYRNYLIKEYRNINRGFLRKMSDQFDQLSDVSISIENQKFHFNKNRDMSTADFKSTVSFYSGTNVNSTSCDGLLVFIYTQSYIYSLDAVFYYDSSYKQNKFEFENFLSHIEISEDSKIKDDKDNLFQRTGGHLKNIYDFIKTDEGKEFLLYLFIFFFAVIFFQIMKERNPNNSLYKYISKILNILFKITLRSLFRQTDNTQSRESGEINQSNEINYQQHESYISHDTENTVFDDKLSDSSINDDLFSDNYKTNDNFISTSSEFDDSISNQKSDDSLSEDYNFDASESIKK